MSNRYYIHFAYNGADYCGWQKQPNGISVQSVLTQSVSTVLREEVELVAAGRTDAGVHALDMVAHFDCEKNIDDLDKLTSNLNSYLPRSIAVNCIHPVHPDAHARFDALSRKYEYHIVLRKSPFLDGLAARFMPPIDIEAMNNAAKLLFNYTDFTSFSKLHTDVKTNNCTIIDAHWDMRGEELVFTIKANRFLRNMVRAIVGTLIDVGRSKITIDDFAGIIEKKDRCAAGHSVSACGLYFIAAEYPDWIYSVK